MLAALIGCSGGDGAVGDPCSGHGDCGSSLQCIASTCVPRCVRAPDCGDGFACDESGICRLATGQPGDACTAEVDCAPGLTCQLDGVATDENGHLLASCGEPKPGRPAGASCEVDDDCRNDTCALGRCVDLCAETRDCAQGAACMIVPRGLVEEAQTVFDGCVPARGTITFPIAVTAASNVNVELPVPSGAQHASLVMSIDSPDRRTNERVGATRVVSPSGTLLYCDPADEDCRLPTRATDQPVRHALGFDQSVLAMPSNPAVALETGMYQVDIQTVGPNGQPGTAIPRVTAVLRLDAAVILDLHFYFLNLEEHPCRAALGGLQLRAQTAAAEPFFRDFLGALRSILTTAGVSIGTITYEDILDHPELDGLDVADAPRLLQLGAYPTGINVFFVRTLSPVGLQGFTPGPGPGGLARTRQSGIVIGADTLCYRSWSDLARLAAHEMGRYMGLYRNVDVDPAYEDPIDDSPKGTEPGVEENLMFYSELSGGTALTPGQRDILLRSPVLR